MPHNFLRETPAEFEVRVKHDATVLHALVYATDAPEIPVSDQDTRELLEALRHDFVNGSGDYKTPEDYMRNFHNLGQASLQGV